MNKKRTIKSPHLTPVEIASLDGAPVFDPDSCDAAIIHAAMCQGEGFVAVYSYALLLEIFSAEMGSLEAAAEHLSSNVLGMARFMGRRAPIIVSLVDDGDEHHDDDVVLHFKGSDWLVL